MTTQFLYRVDAEQLSLEEVSVDKLVEFPPINTWLFVMVGRGYYCYKESKQEASKLLIDIIDARIQELNDRKELFK